MTTRFGPAARKAIKAVQAAVAAETDRADRLQQAWERECALLRHVSTERQALQQEIDDAKRLALPYSTMFRPAIERMPHLPAGAHVVIQQEGPMDFTPVVDEGLSIEMKRTVQTTPLDFFVETVDRDAMRGQAHICVAFKGEKVCYGISADAVVRTPLRELERIVSREIAPQITRALLTAARARRFA